MIKNIAVCLAAFLLASPTVASEAPIGREERAVVLVSCKTGTGSATRVGPNSYISVDHVTTNEGCTVDGVPIVVTYADPDKDFSTFTAGYGEDMIDVSCAGIKQMQPYIARGHAYGDDTTWYQPLIAVGKYAGFATFVGNVFPGMSGGPILDMKGKIVGTVNIGNPSGGVDLSETPVCN